MNYFAQQPQQQNNRAPDAHFVPVFKHIAVLDPQKTREAGRLIYRDVEAVEVRFPGTRDTRVLPVTSRAMWASDPETGGQIEVSYAEVFAHQYRQFKENQTQTKVGTPLAHAPFLTEARRAELRALNIYTVEMLAELEGQPLKNLGIHGRDLKNQAQQFIDNAKRGAGDLALAAELEAMKQRNEMLENDLKILKEKAAAAAAKEAVKSNGEPSTDALFDDMTTEQLRDFVTSQTGQAPIGTLTRKVLVRMASEARAR